VKVTALELGPFAARAVILADETSGDAMVVDPGFDASVIVRELHLRHLNPRAIVLTHAHLDHAYGIATVKEAFRDALVLLHGDDLPLFRNLSAQAEMFGYPAPNSVVEDGLLVDGQHLALGDGFVLIRHCPGHSPGHIVVIDDVIDAPVAVVGDVLFAGAVGRTDLWGGSFPQLERSIREVLYRLPEHTRVVPGHGADTTIGHERRHNPFVAG